MKRIASTFLGLGLSLAAMGAWAQDFVQLNTNMGDIVLELNAEKAPKTVANFKQYVQDGFYQGTVFHRVIKDFMIQGGGFDVKMQQKETRAPVVSEAKNGLKNTRGAVAMARTNDPNSATAQFFINTVDNPFLDANYTVFGQVVQGMEVVDKIRAVRTGDINPYMGDVPQQPVIIFQATLLDAKPGSKGKAAAKSAVKKAAPSSKK